MNISTTIAAPMLEYVEEEVTLETCRQTIEPVPAEFRFITEECEHPDGPRYDPDISVSARLLSAWIGDLKLDRAQVEQMIGPARLRGVEETAEETYRKKRSIW